MALAASATPAASPPPDSGTRDRGQIRPVLQHFQADRALSGDDKRIVEGRDFRQPLLARQPPALGERIVLAAADDAHLGTERPDTVDFRPRHQRRHADDGPQAPRSGGIGDAAPVIARRAAGYAGHVRSEAGHRIGGAAQLEGANGLRGLQLEEELMPGDRAHVRRGHERRARGDAPRSRGARP
jgi:hypothetical protein